MCRMPYHGADGKAPDMTAFKNNVILWYTHAANSEPPLRPSPMSGMHELDALIEEAWAKNPDSRPTVRSTKVNTQLLADECDVVHAYSKLK